MSPLFHIAELVRIGVEDEKSGVAFYDTLAKKSTHPDLRKLYASLTEQERYHEKRFQEMLDGLGNYQPSETYPGEYISYLRAMLDSRAFNDPVTAGKMADEVAGKEAEALELAIRFERDTLVLLNELRNMVPKNDQEIVDELAREEQGHLVDLNRALKTLAP